MDSSEKTDWNKSISDWKLPTSAGERFYPPWLLKIAEKQGITPGTLEFEELLAEQNKIFNAKYPREENTGEEKNL